MVKIFLSTKFIKIGPRAYVELSCVQTDTLATFPTPRKAHMASLSLSRAVIVDTENAHKTLHSVRCLSGRFSFAVLFFVIWTSYLVSISMICVVWICCRTFGKVSKCVLLIFAQLWNAKFKFSQFHFKISPLEYVIFFRSWKV